MILEPLYLVQQADYKIHSTYNETKLKFIPLK